MCLDHVDVKMTSGLSASSSFLYLGLMDGSEIVLQVVWMLVAVPEFCGCRDDVCIW